jgi:hypothetical protein
MGEFRQLDSVIEFAEDALRQRPDMSGAELLKRLRAMRSSAERYVERATCQHCGYAIYSRHIEGSAPSCREEIWIANNRLLSNARRVVAGPAARPRARRGRGSPRRWTRLQAGLAAAARQDDMVVDGTGHDIPGTGLTSWPMPSWR